MKKGNKLNGVLFKIFLLVVAIILSYKFIMGESNIFTIVDHLVDVLKPILFAILVAYLLYIPAKKIEQLIEKARFPWVKQHARGLSIATTYIISGLLIYIFISLLLPVIWQNVSELIKNIPGILNQAKEYFMHLPPDNVLSKFKIYNEIDKIQHKEFYLNFINKLTVDDVFLQAHRVINIATSIFNVFVTFIVSIYMLYYRSEIKQFILRIISAFINKKASKVFADYTEKINYIFFRYISTQILDGFIVGVIISIALLILKVKYAIALGFLIGTFNLIPFFGAIIAVGISVLITIFTGGIPQAIIMLIVITALQQLDANILNPILLGTSLEINKILIIASVMVGGAYFGPLGMFLAVPAVTIISIIINEVIEHKLKQNKIQELTKKKKRARLCRNYTSNCKA